MSYSARREAKPTSETVKTITDYSTEICSDLNNKDSLPKYYPKEHEVTKWLINQMRCRNGLHHLVNLANVQPSLLSAYFELYDQPNLYIDARTGPGMPAYGLKTVLYLTPLAIAIYFRLKSVERLLLDSSGIRIHARTRQEVDVNAICYIRRSKPRPGPFTVDEYSTTTPAILAVRREFFSGLGILMSAGYNPQEPIPVIERLGTNREKTYWFADILDFGVKLLNTRPGVDVNGLLQTITYRTITMDGPSGMVCCFDPCVYDIKQLMYDPDKNCTQNEMWFSIFQRLVRKGASRNYSNCGNRLIGLLEYVAAVGFFRQKYMPKGNVEYDRDIFARRFNRATNVKKITPDMIVQLTGLEKDSARISIAIDRDVCLCLLTIWLERVRNRCLDRQAQRLYRLLTVALADTGLLHDFLYPPPDIDTYKTIYPRWVSLGIGMVRGRQPSISSNLIPFDFLDEETNDICELEPPQLNEIRQEIGILGHSLGLVDYSDKLYNLGYPRLVEIMTATRGDAEAQYMEPSRTGFNVSAASQPQPESVGLYEPSEDLDQKSVQCVGTNIPRPIGSMNGANRLRGTNYNIKSATDSIKVVSKPLATELQKPETRDSTKDMRWDGYDFDETGTIYQDQQAKRYGEKAHSLDKSKEFKQNNNTQTNYTRRPTRSSRVLTRKDDHKSRAASESSLSSVKQNNCRRRTLERRR